MWPSVLREADITFILQSLTRCVVLNRYYLWPLYGYMLCDCLVNALWPSVSMCFLSHFYHRIANVTRRKKTSLWNCSCSITEVIDCICTKIGLKHIVLTAIGFIITIHLTWNTVYCHDPNRAMKTQLINNPLGVPNVDLIPWRITAVTPVTYTGDKVNTGQQITSWTL